MPSPTHAQRRRGVPSGDESGALPARVASVLGRYQQPVGEGLRRAVDRMRLAPRDGPATSNLGWSGAEADAALRGPLDVFYGQMAYHLGWREADLRPAAAHPGKLLRPTLLLLSCELAVGRQGGDAVASAQAIARAVPAAVAVELVHNFSLIHDDIEDGDEVRRHRSTLWRLWGQPQAINTGDGMFALARLALFDLRDHGVAPGLVTELAVLLDQTCLWLCEGQHLDMSFEGRYDVTPAMYLAMIERKTAALMACALEMGARLGGADDALAAQLATFGGALGLGFQLRDDLLGIWASRAELGKSAAGDLRRKKMSLPVIYGLERADPEDREALLAIYAGAEPAGDEQIALARRVLERAGARARVRAALHEQCERARAALDAATGTDPAAREAGEQLRTLVDFVAGEAR